MTLGAVSNILSSALETLLPSRCVGCGKAGAYFCDRCAASAKRSGLTPLPDSSRLSDVIAPFAYAGVPRAAVQHLKYRGLRAIAPRMAAPMTRDLALAIPPPFTLVPVPLHPSRLRERGYNQAELLAKEIASALDRPLRTDVLKRTRAAPPQVSSQSRSERIRNVQDAFASAPIDGEVVVLVDDVTTTGATLEAAARALGKAGAARVYGLAFAYEARET